MIKAVIFDLDDTLTSEREFIKSGYRHVAGLISNKMKLDSMFIYNMLMRLFAESPKNVFNRLYDQLGIPYTQEDIVELVEAYRNHDPDIHFYDDVIPCLEDLKKRGIKTGIITDGYRCTQRNKLRALNAYAYFDHIIVTDELGRDYWKPNPRPFELIRAFISNNGEIDIRYEEMIYVGDNPEKDFYISAIYPIRTVRIIRDGIYKNNEYLNSIKENMTIANLNELIIILLHG